MNIPFGREKRRAESYQQMKSQSDCPSPEFPLASRANSRVPARVCDVEAAQFVRKKHIWLFRWNRMDPALAVSYSDCGSCVNLRLARCAGALKRSCCAPPSRDSNTQNNKRNFMIKASLGIASVAGKCVCTTRF